jgi:SAM-dependent methyltransferase
MWSDSWYNPVWTNEGRIQALLEQPSSAFHHKVLDQLTSLRAKLRGSRVCVLASGDNHAVFAFHAMGALVTSVDISERQIENARMVAENHGWEIEFICSDITRLEGIGNAMYDLVYTSNGVHVWIDDLWAMYKNIFRVLRPGGDQVMFEVHPFTRPFTYDEEKQRDVGRVSVEKPYHDVGPSGEPPEYTWRFQDFVNAIADSGLCICHVEEFDAEVGTYWGDLDDRQRRGNDVSLDEIAWRYDWHQNPLAAIPQWVVVRSRKPA